MAISKDISNLQRYYGKNIEKPIDIEEELKDRDFKEKEEKATPEKTKQMQEEVKFILYGNNGNIDEKQEKKQEIPNKKQIEENPNSPLIDTFVLQGLLNKQEGILVKQALIKKGEQKKQILSIKGLNKRKKQQLIDSLDFLSKPENKILCKEKFYKDFQLEIEEFKVNIDGGKKGEKELFGKNKLLIDLIGFNYFSYKGKNGKKENKKDSLDRAIKITVNQLMFGKKFQRPDSFDDMLIIVKNPNFSFKERFKELKKIDILIGNDQSRANGRQAKAFQDRKGQDKIKTYNIKQKFDDFKNQAQIFIEQKKLNKIKQLKVELIELKDEVKSSGDVFNVGEIDTFLEEIEGNLKEG